MQSTWCTGICFPAPNWLFDLSTATTAASFSLHDWGLGVITHGIKWFSTVITSAVTAQIFGQRVSWFHLTHTNDAFKPSESDLWSQIPGLIPHSDTWSDSQPVMPPPFDQFHSWLHKWVSNTFTGHSRIFGSFIVFFRHHLTKASSSSSELRLSMSSSPVGRRNTRTKRSLNQTWGSMEDTWEKQ